MAEAQIDLRRVRSARQQLLTRALNDPHHEAQEELVLTRFLTPLPQCPEKFAIILSQETKRLLAMDRYERRALFRRRIAVQAFDESKA